MTKVIFIANGERFNTYAMARAVSVHVDVEYLEFWNDPEELEKAELRRAAYRKKLEVLNTVELCAERKGNFK